MLRVTCSVDGRIALVLNAMRAFNHNGANSASIDNLSTQGIIDTTFGSGKTACNKNQLSSHDALGIHLTLGSALAPIKRNHAQASYVTLFAQNLYRIGSE